MKKKKPAPRRKPGRPKRGHKGTASPGPPAVPPPGDMVHRAKLLRHMELLGRVKRNQALKPREIAELAELEAERGRAAGAPERGPLVAGEPLLVSTQAQLAGVYGVAARTVENWLVESDWPGGRRGPYDLATIGPWVRRKHERGPQGDKLDEAKLRRMLAQAKLAEMTECVRRGELIPLAEVLSTWQTCALQLRQLLESLGARHGDAFLAKVQAGLGRLEAQLVRLLPAAPAAAAAREEAAHG